MMQGISKQFITTESTTGDGSDWASHHDDGTWNETGEEN
jgi:hypothetical protein